MPIYRKAQSIIILLFLVTFFSCVSTNRYENYSNRPIDSYIAENHIKNKKFNDAIERLEYCLKNDLGIDKHVKMFRDKYPETLPHIVKYYENKAHEADSIFDFETIRDNLERMNEYYLLSDQNHTTLFNELQEIAVKKNSDGSVKYLLTDSLEIFPILQERENKYIIFERSVKGLIQNLHLNNSQSLQKEVLKYVISLEKGSPEFQFLKASLSELDFSKTLMRNEVAQLFPDYSKKWIEVHTAKIRLTSPENGDAYLFEIEKELQKNKDIIITDSSAEDIFKLEIKKTRFVERYIPERTQTVRYAKYQVNLAGAVLMMPKNATYIYDYITGGYEISYAFSMKLFQNGKKVAEKRVSGKESDEYKYCSDPRIRNVFGGVSPASFIANADMQYRCASNQKSVNENDVFNEMIERVAYEIIMLDPIRNRIDNGIF